MHVTAFTYFKR